MTYFAYGRSTVGKWKPVKSDRQFVKVSPEGRRFKFIQITELPKEQENLSLDELAQIYPLEGEPA